MIPARILAALAHLKDVTAADFARGLGISPRKIKKALTALHRVGAVARRRSDRRTYGARAYAYRLPTRARSDA